MATNPPSFLGDDFAEIGSEDSYVDNGIPEVVTSVESLAEVAETASDLGDVTELPETEVSPEEIPVLLERGFSRETMARLDRSVRDLAAVSGRRDALVSREQELVEKVATAKGRMSLKPEVEGFLEQLQKMAHERSVGAFERMLTAIARDVNPGSKIEVKLNLTTERNMPALDISASVNGEREQITSGELANVISTGLRFITLARSGRRRFMVLDEADCWISNDNVQNFFNVVNQLSREAGIQTVIITHHDLSAFSEDFRIYKVSTIESDDAWPMRTLELESQGRMEMSEFQDSYVQSLELENFEAYKHARLEFSPGVTAITGPNRHGKSAIARALRGALLGDSSDDNIRHKKPGTAVHVGFSDGRVLSHHRRQKGNPRAEFIMHSPESWDYARQNPNWAKDPESPVPLHHSPTARLPEWVPKETGIGEVDGINVQLWGQLTPVFMLDQPASKLASLLAIGRESGHLFAMNEIYKDDLRQDNLSIREGEKEIGAIRLTLDGLKGLDELQSAHDALSAGLHALAQEHQQLSERARIADEIVRHRAEIDQALAISALLQSLPSAPEVERTEGIEVWLGRVAEALSMVAEHTDLKVPETPVIEATIDAKSLLEQLSEAQAMMSEKTDLKAPEMPPLEDTVELARFLQEVSQAQQDAALAGKMPASPSPVDVEDTRVLEELIKGIAQARKDMEFLQAGVTALPEPPALEATDAITALLSDISRNTQFIQSCRAQVDTLVTEQKQVEQEIQAISELINNECPVCHQHMDVEMLLGHKPHDHVAEPLQVFEPESLLTSEGSVSSIDLEQGTSTAARAGGFRKMGFRR